MIGDMGHGWLSGSRCMAENFYFATTAGVIFTGVMLACFAEVRLESHILSPLFREKGNGPDMTLFQLPTELPAMLEPLKKLTRRWRMRVSFFFKLRQIRKMAESKRQVFYLATKYLLGMPIRENETEVQTYLDFKHGLEIWPFMWEVSNVKQDQIKCADVACVPMSSYSYLDMVRCEEVQEAAIAAAREWSCGNHGPRMLGGNMSILRDLEKVVGRFFGRQDSLICATGYLACMSAVSAVAQTADVIFADSRIHSSLSTGVRLSRAKAIYFPHNNYVALERLMKKNRKKYKRSWLVIESVYSMDGDIADLPVLHALAQKYDTRIILDEAHGLGVLGKTGRGLEEYYNMPGAATLICGTFSKSVGTIGGYIVGEKDLVDFMDFHAVGNLFSAPLPAYCAGAALKSFELFDTQPWRTKTAQEMSVYLRECLESGLGHWPAGFPENYKYELEGLPCTTVIPVVVPFDPPRVFDIAHRMKNRGWMLSAVAFPACPVDRPRFRVTSTSAYTKELIHDFVRNLVEVFVEAKPTKNLEALMF
eukprot:Polyplicarium_translucidae@DN3295_c0_g1_i1.p1